MATRTLYPVSIMSSKVAYRTAFDDNRVLILLASSCRFDEGVAVAALGIGAVLPVTRRRGRSRHIWPQIRSQQYYTAFCLVPTIQKCQDLFAHHGVEFDANFRLDFTYLRALWHESGIYSKFQYIPLSLQGESYICWPTWVFLPPPHPCRSPT